jgi:hypothetical protein
MKVTRVDTRSVLNSRLANDVNFANIYSSFGRRDLQIIATDSEKPARIVEK